MTRRSLIVPNYLDDLKDYNLLVYLYLQEMIYKDETRIATSVLIENITKEKETKKGVRTNILNALNYLIDNGIIDGIRFSKYTYIIKKYSFAVDDGYGFTLLYFDEIEKIHNVKLLYYYKVLMSTINNKTKFSNMSLRYIADKSSLNINTVTKYNKELQDLGIIFIKNPLLSDEHRKNIYCRIEDKDIINEYFKNDKNYPDSEIIDSVNWQRSVTARYNAFLSGKKFGEEEKQKLYEDCIKYNELMDQKQKRQPGNDYIKKKKDLSIFK